MHVNSSTLNRSQIQLCVCVLTQREGDSRGEMTYRKKGLNFRHLLGLDHNSQSGLSRPLFVPQLNSKSDI